jgi:PPP family 3-phenylpropionic acid transporter
MRTLLALFYFFYFAVVGVYIIFLPKVLSLHGYTPSEIGIIFAAAPLVRFIVPFAFIKGLKLDKKSLHVALVLMVFGAVAFYFSLDSFYKLLGSNIALGIGLSLVLPYIEFISLSHIGKEGYGKIRLFGSVGFVLVALVLVKFLQNPQTALLYLLVLTLFSAFFAYLIAAQSNAILNKSETNTNDISLLKDYKLWLGLTLMQVSFGAYYNFFTIYETAHAMSMQDTIYLWSFGVGAEIVMLYFQGRFLSKNLLLILQITTFATALRWFMLYMFASEFAIILFSQAFHALSFALFHSAAISYLFWLYRHKSLAQQFFSGITYGLGGFVGALLSGYIYEFYPKELFLSSSLLALMACGLIYMWSKTLTPERLSA